MVTHYVRMGKVHYCIILHLNQDMVSEGGASQVAQTCPNSIMK